MLLRNLPQGREESFGRNMCPMGHNVIHVLERSVARTGAVFDRNFPASIVAVDDEAIGRLADVAMFTTDDRQPEMNMRASLTAQLRSRRASVAPRLFGRRPRDPDIRGKDKA